MVSRVQSKNNFTLDIVFLDESYIIYQKVELVVLNLTLLFNKKLILHINYLIIEFYANKKKIHSIKTNIDNKP